MVGNRAGPHVFATLQRAAASARGEAAQAELALAQARDALAARTREHLQDLQALAALELPELTPAHAGAALPEAAAELLEFERQRAARQAELAAQAAALQAQVAAAEAALAAVTAELEAVVARREELLAAVRDRLAADPEHGPQVAAATQAEVRLARDLERAEELAAEAKEKLPPYERSRLFQYLWRRQFGTGAYRGRGFAARMDRRVAALIDYPAAAASYRFLTTTPRVVRLAVERREQEVAALRQALQQRIDAAEAACGVPPVRAQGQAIGQRRDQQLAELQRLQEQQAAVQRAGREEAGSRGAFHARALQRLVEHLGRAETAVLERRARGTPDPRDDALVARLRAHRAELQRLADALPPLEHRAAERDLVADGLEDLLRRYRRAEYDASRSYFTDLDLDGLVQHVRDGRLSPEGFWQRLEQAHRFRPTQLVEPTSDAANVLRGVGLALRIAGAVADVAMSSRGGSRSGGSFRSGGGFGGGGFRSGGGFGGGGFTSGKGF